jgi:RimJ/RimL family protein N-acetyltransferase
MHAAHITMSLHQTDPLRGPFHAAVMARHGRCSRMPRLRGSRLTLRELRATDAVSLSALLTTEAVTRFILPPPKDLKAFRDFIAWTHGEQEAGRQYCFAMVPHRRHRAVGLIQVRCAATNSASAEWGFVLGHRYWGTGLFVEGATIVLDFLFATAGIHRLEARTAISNPRGNGVLQKLGFDRQWRYEGAFVKDGERFDEALWSMTADRWKSAHGESPALSAPAARNGSGIARTRAAH